VNSAALVQARVLEIWRHYQKELRRVLAPLTDEQMSLRLVPNRRSVGEIAEHIVRARALWLPQALGTDPAELTPIKRWDDPDDPPRTAGEVVQGLDTTWRFVNACLDRWPADEPRDTVSEAETLQLRTLWGLFEHDVQHGGQLSFVLGSYGLDTIDA
jgi:uncharacterized damage-inducible protein DinB